MHDVIAGARTIRRAWPGVVVDYAWLPPWEGETPRRANRVKVVFSQHPRVAQNHEGKMLDLCVPAGAALVMGPEETSIARVPEHSETIDLYPDLDLVRSEAAARGIADFALEGLLSRGRRDALPVNPVFLCLALRFRRACMDGSLLSETEGSELAAVLANAIIDEQRGRAPDQVTGLDATRLAAVYAFVGDTLPGQITVAAMARQTGLSTWHFARAFRAATGLSPGQYVLGQRIELAKRLFQTTDLPVWDVAWAAGFENISHFRRIFGREVGLRPGDFRSVTRKPASLVS